MLTPYYTYTTTRGILWGPVTGLVIKQLLLHEPLCVNIDAFNPGRFSVTLMGRSSTDRGRKQGSAAVGEQW